MRSHHLLFLLLPFFIAPLLYAQESEWNNLAQIKPGAKIQVIEQSLKSTSGKFVGFSDAALTANVNGREVTIPRRQVYRVSVVGKNRKRNVLLGLAFGAGVGLGVGFALKNNVATSERPALIAGLTPVYAGAGAGIGALLPSSKSVYSGAPSEHARADGPSSSFHP